MSCGDINFCLLLLFGSTDKFNSKKTGNKGNSEIIRQ